VKEVDFGLRTLLCATKVTFSASKDVGYVGRRRPGGNGRRADRGQRGRAVSAPVPPAGMAARIPGHTPVGRELARTAWRMLVLAACVQAAWARARVRYLGDNAGPRRPHSTPAPSIGPNCTAAPVQWCECAAEQGDCPCLGLVRFGNAEWNMWSDGVAVNGTIGCNNDVFGDPASEKSAPVVPPVARLPCLACLPRLPPGRYAARIRVAHSSTAPRPNVPLALQ
jgi:hypothetical protein